jgi:RNA polymerase sigma factor (sigma-70 family)
LNQSEHFLTTRWTQVLAAQGASTQAGKALADLCASYYAPVHTYITRTAWDLGDARDLTQEFFSRLLAGGSLLGVERERGRFRAYLLGAVKHYLADTRDHLGAARRGARHPHLPLEAGTDTSPGIECAAPEARPPDAWFDRQWGLAVLDLALASLAAEHEEKGKPEHFQLLKPWLTGDAVEMSQTEAAARLGISEGAVKVAIHRLRRRFRDLVKAEIAQTVSTEHEAREELRYLIEVVS